MDIREQIDLLKRGELCGDDPCRAIEPGICPCATAADTMEKLFDAVTELWTVADTRDLDAEMALFVGGCVAEEMRRDQTRRAE